MSPRKVIPPSQRKSYKKKVSSKFCTNVQARRLEIGITQEQLANLTNSTTPWISQMEAGRFPRDEYKITAIANALGVDINWLFGFNQPHGDD